MKASTPTADTPLRRAWPLGLRGQAGGLAAQSVGILFKDAFLLPAPHARLAWRLSGLVTNPSCNNAG
ncbi:MAG: hypothetical protein ACT4OO_09795 [Nitrospiraceae bacterium]